MAELACVEDTQSPTAKHAANGISAAVIAHAYYPDVFAQILDLVCKIPEQHKLFVTTLPEHEATLRGMLEESGRIFELYVVRNRGRDVLPFINILPKLLADHFDLVIKVHTKKSPQRGDGDQWRDDMLEKLLHVESLATALQAFTTDLSLGMIGPDGHFVSISSYMGGNKSRVFSIGTRLGMSKPEVARQGFFAGTMFIARIEALEPLRLLAFADEDFEPEAGQRDGTLAHALERCMALSVLAAGKRVASTTSNGSSATINENYRFGRKPKLRHRMRRFLWQHGYG